MQLLCSLMSFLPSPVWDGELQLQGATTGLLKGACESAGSRQLLPFVEPYLGKWILLPKAASF